MVHSDAMALVVPAASQIRRVDDGGAAGVELGHEGVVGAATVGCLKRVRCREVRGRSVPRHIRVARDVKSDALAPVVRSAPQVGRVDRGGATGIELRHEGVDRAPEDLLESPRRRRKVRGVGRTCHVGVARTVDRDAESNFVIVAPEIGGIHARPGGTELRHENVEAAPEARRPEGPRRRRKVRGSGSTRHVSAA